MLPPLPSSRSRNDCYTEPWVRSQVQVRIAQHCDRQAASGGRRLEKWFKWDAETFVLGVKEQEAVEEA